LAADRSERVVAYPAAVVGLWSGGRSPAKRASGSGRAQAAGCGRHTATAPSVDSGPAPARRSVSCGRVARARGCSSGRRARVSSAAAAGSGRHAGPGWRAYGWGSRAAADHVPADALEQDSPPPERSHNVAVSVGFPSRRSGCSARGPPLASATNCRLSGGSEQLASSRAHAGVSASSTIGGPHVEMKISGDTLRHGPVAACPNRGRLVRRPGRGRALRCRRQRSPHTPQASAADLRPGSAHRAADARAVTAGVRGGRLMATMCQL
jgi:hypothetical protein